MEDILQIKELELQVGEFNLGPINLNLKQGELFAILGKTGAGKSLFLELIADCYKTYKGSIVFGTKIQTGIVFQDYKLFPHMTVEENIGYGLKCRHIKKVQIEEVRKMSLVFGLEESLGKYPNTLSGGEKQRTALARTMIVRPELLLLDEPFCALDAMTKKELYKNLIMVQKEFQCTILLVTHDFEEALCLADRIGVLLNGKLLAVSKKKELLLHTWSEEVNEFLGVRRLSKGIEFCDDEKRII